MCYRANLLHCTNRLLAPKHYLSLRAEIYTDAKPLSVGRSTRPNHDLPWIFTPPSTPKNMTSGILKPLAVFCSQSQSQRYIKSIRNLGDAWRTLADEPIPESDREVSIIQTTFDLSLKIKHEQEDEISVDIITSESPSLTGLSKPIEPARHYRIRRLRNRLPLARF